jgi:hypothetical protein
MEFEVLGPSDFKPKGGRRKRGGAEPDQATVVEPEELVIQDNTPVTDLGDLPNKDSYRTIAMGMLTNIVNNVRTGLVDVITSDIAKQTAMLGVTVAVAATVINKVDHIYSADMCSPLTVQVASSLSSVGFTTKENQCAAAAKAYDDVFNLLKPAIAAAVAVPAGKLVDTIRIKVGEGFIATAMVAIAKRFGLSSSSDAATAPKGKKGGRTKRRGSKKGRKGGKSRKHRR